MFLEQVSSTIVKNMGTVYVSCPGAGIAYFVWTKRTHQIRIPVFTSNQLYYFDFRARDKNEDE